MEEKQKKRNDGCLGHVMAVQQNQDRRRVNDSRRRRYNTTNTGIPRDTQQLKFAWGRGAEFGWCAQRKSATFLGISSIWVW